MFLTSKMACPYDFFQFIIGYQFIKQNLHPILSLLFSEI